MARQRLANSRMHDTRALYPEIMVGEHIMSCSYSEGQTNRGCLFLIRGIRALRICIKSGKFSRSGINTGHTIAQVAALKMEVQEGQFEDDHEGQELAAAINAHLPAEVGLCRTEQKREE